MKFIAGHDRLRRAGHSVFRQPHRRRRALAGACSGRVTRPRGQTAPTAAAGRSDGHCWWPERPLVGRPRQSGGRDVPTTATPGAVRVSTARTRRPPLSTPRPPVGASTAVRVDLAPRRDARFEHRPAPSAPRRSPALPRSARERGYCRQACPAPGTERPPLRAPDRVGTYPAVRRRPSGAGGLGGRPTGAIRRPGERQRPGARGTPSHEVRSGRTGRPASTIGP